MDARFYNSEDIDIERLATDLINVYLAQGYQAQQIGTKDQVLVQVKKGGDFEAIIGMQAALSVTLQRTSGGILAMLGKQRWIDKAAVGAVGIFALPVLWPLALTAGVGALRQASLGNQALNLVDGLVRQQRPGVQIGPVPVQVMPQIQQQWAPAPALPAPLYTPPQQQTPAYMPPPQIINMQQAPVSNRLHCVHCNTPYEAGDTFCSGCGRALTAPRLYCSNCNTEIKNGASFCPKCGASTFHTLSGTGQSSARPAPAPTPASYTSAAPVQPPAYTPPPRQDPPVPSYQPPIQPAYQPPAQPLYTPPTPPPAPVQPPYVPPVTQDPVVQPQPTVYYMPSSSPSTVDASAPTIASQPPTEPYYVPPVTQDPVVTPQPKVSIVPNKPKQEPPAPAKPRPQKQYYIPSNQGSEAAATEPVNQSSAAAPTEPASQSTAGQAQELAASLAGQSDLNQNKPWGTLTFGDGQQVQLLGERAVVGRYDHDLGGLQPEVDLSQMQGADTTSRVHAALEHSGNTYTLTDLNSTNATRINGKRLEPDKATPITNGDTLLFGKVSCTFQVA